MDFSFFLNLAGYITTPLYKKLGIKQGMNIELINAPTAYGDWVDNTLANTNTEPPYDFVHLFTNTRSELVYALKTYRSKIKPNGMVWVSWYKKAVKKPTEITADVVRREALQHGWVEAKVCAVSVEWSGLKLVIPVKNR